MTHFPFEIYIHVTVNRLYSYCKKQVLKYHNIKIIRVYISRLILFKFFNKVKVE